MADQKELKKRLKVLMSKPENQFCSDCPERQPRWASLIVPPPGSPPGTMATGAFCCLECSGSHRRLGVHISFVRSINLDSWKEKEVLAMENGGNKKVNAIWEANLARMGGRKPATGADLTTRERYIRDKYERRKFFDMQALANYQSNEPSIDELVPQGGADFANFGPPPDAQVSDAARLRAEKKKKKTPARNRSFEAPARTKSNERNRRPKKPEPEPQQQPVVDLLDFGSDPTPPAPATSNGAAAASPFGDVFGAEPAQNGTAAPSAESRQGSQDGGRSRASRSRSKSREELRTKSKTPDREKTRKSQQQDILNMYKTPIAGQPMGGGMGGMPNNMAANNNNMMAMMQQMQQMNMNGGGGGGQQMQQPGGFGGVTQDVSSGGSKHNSRLQMHQNLMMQQMQSQMQQQQRNLQQMQRMMQQNPQMMQQMQAQMQQQQPGGMMNGMNPQMMQAMMNKNNMMQQQGQGGGMNPNMMMGMNPAMMMGMNPNMMMGMNANMMQQQQPQAVNAFGGMPMGGSPAANVRASANKAPEKEDPFAQFGMNAFR